MSRHDAYRLLARLDRWFRLDMPAARFGLHVLIVSAAGLVPALAVFIALSPGLAAHLASDATALMRFGRQILTNGVPVVLVVNFIGFVLFAARGRRGPVATLGVDLAARLAAFIGLHAVIYPASALWFDSFGGDPAQALRVVAPTLAAAAGFSNLSGAYLYATLLGAAPLAGAAALALAQGRGRMAQGLGAALARLPDRARGPVLIGGGVLVYVGVVAGLLTLIAGRLAV